MSNKEPLLVIYIDPSTRFLTKGKVYAVIDETLTGTGCPIYRIKKDNGLTGGFFTRRFIPLTSAQLIIRTALKE